MTYPNPDDQRPAQYPPPPPPMGYPAGPPMMYGGYPQAPSGNGMAVAALVLGIIGIFVFNVILGPLAIIFGSIGLSRANRGLPKKTMAGWGLGLGIFDVALGVVALILEAKFGLI